MHRPSVRAITWSLRLFSLVIALWWPAIFRDPIYTPRHARLTGQDLRLPDSSPLRPDDERALAIFWNWENRTLVSTRWVLGSCRGIRDPGGRVQTLIVLAVFWGIGSLLLSRWASRAPVTTEPRRRGVVTWLSTPIWQWFMRRPYDLENR